MLEFHLSALKYLYGVRFIPVFHGYRALGPRILVQNDGTESSLRTINRDEMLAEPNNHLITPSEDFTARTILFDRRLPSSSNLIVRNIILLELLKRNCLHFARTTSRHRKSLL